MKRWNTSFIEGETWRAYQIQNVWRWKEETGKIKERVAKESVLLASVIDTKGKREVAVTNIPGAYLPVEN